ncbi:MAG: hypothetical protein NZL89_06190 [Leptospiraceae bacterium]|nr:hypothetical protein [Leptospiraceae bacterium]
MQWQSRVQIGLPMLSNMLAFFTLWQWLQAQPYWDQLPPMTNVSTRAKPVRRWQIPPENLDMLLVRNVPNYVVEGYAAAGMLLGETELELRQR